MTPLPPIPGPDPVRPDPVRPEPIGTRPARRRKDPSRIPVRGAIGLGVTAAGMAFLLSLRPPAGGELAFAVEPADDAATTTTVMAQADPSAAPASEPAASGGPDASASADPCAVADASADPVASVDPAASADPSAMGDACAAASPAATSAVAATPEATATPEPTEAATGLTGTATGDAVSFKYGAVQVEVTLENGVITDITALQLPDEDRKSLAISNEVEPMLLQEALQAQSADIDVISGATYTSLAYAQSLQSALDRLAA